MKPKYRYPITNEQMEKRQLALLNTLKELEDDGSFEDEVRDIVKRDYHGEEL